MKKQKKLCINLLIMLLEISIIYVLVNIILGFHITYRNASVLCQSECACLHQTVIMVVFFVKSNENNHRKGRVLMQMLSCPLNKQRELSDRLNCFNYSPLNTPVKDDNSLSLFAECGFWD